MAEFRNFSQKRQLVQTDIFLSKSNESFIMCMSGSMLYAFRQIVERILWRTSWVKEYQEDGYTLPDDTEWDQIEGIISEWIHESEVIELCNQQLISALNDIATSVRLSACCDGSGAGGQQIGDDFYYGTEDPLSEPTSFGPGQEFDTVEEYEAFKCEAANAIVNSLIGSLNSMSVLTLASLVAGSIAVAIVGVGLLVVPPVAVLVALAFTGLAFGALSSLANEINDNRAGLVCLLYDAPDALTAYTDLKTYIEDLSLDIGFVEIEISAVADLIMNMCPIDTMNTLFQNVGLPLVPGEQINCQSTCEGCPEFTVIHGDYNPATGVVTSTLSLSQHRIYIVFNGTNLEMCGDPVDISVQIDSGSIGCSGDGYRFQTEPGVWFYNSDTPPSYPISANGIYLKNCQPAAFQVTLTLA